MNWLENPSLRKSKGGGLKPRLIYWSNLILCFFLNELNNHDAWLRLSFWDLNSCTLPTRGNYQGYQNYLLSLLCMWELKTPEAAPSFFRSRQDAEEFTPLAPHGSPWHPLPTHIPDLNVVLASTHSNPQATIYRISAIMCNFK